MLRCEGMQERTIPLLHPFPRYQACHVDAPSAHALLHKGVHVHLMRGAGARLTRERTCPMCRAVIRPPGVHAFDDGATSLYPQIF